MFLFAWQDGEFAFIKHMRRSTFGAQRAGGQEGKGNLATLEWGVVIPAGFGSFLSSALIRTFISFVILFPSGRYYEIDWSGLAGMAWQYIHFYFFPFALVHAMASFRG